MVSLPIPSLGSRGDKHTWRFARAGGFDQVRLDTGADIASLDQLDQKLWVALGCPTRGLEFDTRTLDLIDTDHDGRIRAPEVLAATRWACAALKNPDLLLQGSSSLALDAINDATAEGRQLLASAKQVLANLSKAGSTAVSIDDVTDTARIFAQTRLNGDGVVTPVSAEDPQLQGVITDIISCLGGVTDRSGKPGVDQATAERFFGDARAYADWQAKAESDRAALLPLGDATAAAAAALRAVKAKVEDYFTRCRLAAYDPRAAELLGAQDPQFEAIAPRSLSLETLDVAALPLARVFTDPARGLPLSATVNPAWAGALAALQTLAVKPLLGDKSELIEADWRLLVSKFCAYEAWSAAKPVSCAEKLGLARIRAILDGPYQNALGVLIAADKAVEPEASAIASVYRLVYYNRDLYKLLNNFICFRDFYGRRDKAIFQAGTLYLDQRSCDLCVYVHDMGRHGFMAHLSYAYLAYCELTRKDSPEKLTIAAAFSAGDSDNLMVGRNGVFYDRKGRDWDATIIKIVDNPISISQAFWSPYKRTLRWVEDQIAKRAAAADSQADSAMVGGLTAAQQAAQTRGGGASGGAGTSGGAPAKGWKIDIGVVAALGVAVGGITAALGMLLQAFFGLGRYMPLGVLALMLLISGPSMVIAALKLRRRNLGPLLDANGWAVNAKARINIPFGGSLTGTPTLPPGSRRDLIDPFAEKKTWRYKLAIVVVVLAVLGGLWYLGIWERRLVPDVLPQSRWWIKHHPAPAATQPSTDRGAALRLTC